MKIAKWSVVDFMEGIEPEVINTDVAFIEDSKKRYIISIDKETNSICIYKTGFNNDELVITPKGSNRILIR